MKDESRVNCLGVFFLGVFVVLLLSSCYDTPQFARFPQAENDDTVWEGKKLKEWRWDLRGFRSVKKCASEASSAIEYAQ